MSRRTQDIERLGLLHLRLIERRLARGWSLNDLARQAQIDGNTARAAERGDHVSSRTQKAIADALECDLLDLFPVQRVAA